MLSAEDQDEGLDFWTPVSYPVLGPVLAPGWLGIFELPPLGAMVGVEAQVMIELSRREFKWVPTP